MTLPTTRPDELPAEVEERVWFCPECGISGPEMVSVDEDGCCCICGNGACRMSQLKALLAHHGLHIVGAEEMRELETLRLLVDDVAAKCFEILGPKMSPSLHETRCAMHDIAKRCNAELARREKGGGR